MTSFLYVNKWHVQKEQAEDRVEHMVTMHKALASISTTKQ